jgi:hypothetical protein
MKALGDNPDIRDWGVPVLYLRTPGGRIFNPVSDQAAKEKAEKETSSRVTQQIGTIGATGRVIGSMTSDVKVDKVEVIQDAKKVEGIMIGNYSVNFKDGRIDVNQKVDTVSGNLVGAVLVDGSEDTSFRNIENWYKSTFKKDDRIQIGNRYSHKESVAGEKRKIDTGGGSYYESKISTGGGEFTGHDKTIYGHSLSDTSFNGIHKRKTGPENENANSCPKCHKQVEAGARFCDGCGNRLPIAGKYCANCGAELSSGGKFCHICGRKVG